MPYQICIGRLAGAFLESRLNGIQKTGIHLVAESTFMLKTGGLNVTISICRTPIFNVNTVHHAVPIEPMICACRLKLGVRIIWTNMPDKFCGSSPIIGKSVAVNSSSTGAYTPSRYDLKFIILLIIVPYHRRYHRSVTPVPSMKILSWGRLYVITE